MPEPIYLNGFAGGLNQYLSGKDIADNELVTSLNLELTQNQTLRRRAGVSKVVAASPGSPFTSALTSVFHFVSSDGASTVVYTDKLGAWRHSPGEPDSPSAMTDIATGVTLSNTSRVEWVTMDDAAIGVRGTDGSGTYANPIIMPSPSDVLTDAAGDSWTGTYPSAPEHIAVWNRRLWLSQGNQLYGSALGDRTNFLSTGGAGRVQETVGEDEGSDITGIVSFYDRLIIFKRNSIYQMLAGSPNVDANQYEIRLLSNKVGCLDIGSVQELMNDLVFLSEYGVMSLQAVAQYGDFKQARLSKNIPALSLLNTAGAQVSSIVRPDKNQYWISVPDTAGSSNNTAVWVLDFQNIGQGPLPWMKFDGGVCGSAYGLISVQGNQRVYIGGYDDAYILDDTRWDDDVGTAYKASGCYFQTKSMDLGDPMRRKEFHKVGIQLVSLTDPVDFTLRWELDTDPTRQKQVAGSFSAASTGSALDDATDALLWNDALDTGSFLLATDAADDSDVIWGIRGSKGRRGQTISFKFSVADPTHAFEVRRMMMLVTLLPSLFGVADNAGLA